MKSNQGKMVNTLLSYFTRVSPKSETPKAQTPARKGPDSDDKLFHQHKNHSSSGHAHKSPIAKGDDLQLFQVVWGRLEGYPWWPSLVCKDPDTQQFVKNKQKVDLCSYHVQFFDDPPSRAWLPARYVMNVLIYSAILKANQLF